MLETIDLLVGLAVVMLVVSFAVTVTTQLIVSVVNLRGQALYFGIKHLLMLMDSGIGNKCAGQIARQVLLNPLVAQPGPWPRLAQVVHREELTKLLLSLAVEPDLTVMDPREKQRANKLKELRVTVRKSLASNDIPDPVATLKAIRMAVLDLEKTNPEMSNSDRANVAILNFANSDFVGKLNAWFDQTVDRVADNFTSWTRVAAVVVAICVAVGMQLDTISLINRLSTDKEVRTKLVDWAIANPDKVGPQASPPSTSSPSEPAKPSPVGTAHPTAAGKGAAAPVKTGDEASSSGSNALVNAARNTLSNERLVVLPTSIDVWKARWSAAVPCANTGASAAIVADGCPLPRVNPVGVVLSAILLSLGGPFWYEMLKNLLKLRSLVASKDDDQRQDRQTNQTTPTTTGGGAPPTSKPLPAHLAGGEVGDLTAMG